MNGVGRGVRPTPLPKTRYRPARRGRRKPSGVDGVRRLLSRLIGLALIIATLSFGISHWRAAQRRAAAWRRIGTCRAVGDTSEVRCSGVHLVKLKLPGSLGHCRGVANCHAPVNAEALPHFRLALKEVTAKGLGRYITTFDTVNKRRCKDARTGEFIPNCVSKHSYGTAVDIRDFADNTNWKSVVRRDPQVLRVIAIFRHHGFRWGGTFASNFDPQHLEWQPS